MAVKCNQISRVVIAGSWYSIEVGSFKVVPFGFLDDSGQMIGDEPKELAYEFYTIDRDFYTGPISSIQLVKLVPQ